MEYKKEIQIITTLLDINFKKVKEGGGFTKWHSELDVFSKNIKKFLKQVVDSVFGWFI